MATSLASAPQGDVIHGRVASDEKTIRVPCAKLCSVENDRLGKTMNRHAFNVADTFNIQGRGVVVATDKRYEELPSWLALKVGDEIELRSDGNAVRTRIAGIEFVDPWNPKTPFGFLLPADVTKAQVPSGCEIWVTESSVVDALRDQ